MVDPQGSILFIYVEQENSTWPSIEEIVEQVGDCINLILIVSCIKVRIQVKKNSKKKTTEKAGSSKVDSELSAGKAAESAGEKAEGKKCCAIL